MNMRATMLGGVGLGVLLGGCPFEEPPVIQGSESETAGEVTTSGNTSTTPTTMTTTDAPTTDEPTTNVPTTDDPTTMGSVDDTTMSTTVEVTATDSSTSLGTTGDPCEALCAGLLCGDSSGCDCGECGPMATCATDQTYCGLPVGFYNDFGANAQVNAQVQLGFRFQVFEDTVVRRLGVIAGGAGANVRLALYSHDGSGPADRLVQTGAVMLYANGNNEFDVGATPITAGNFYWVMLHTEGSTPLRRTFNGDNMYEAAVRTTIPFAAGFPVTMDDEVVVNDYRYNLYMVVEE